MSRKTSRLSSLKCLVRAADEVASHAAPQALALAAAMEAHIALTVISPKAHMPYSPLASSFVASMVRELDEKSAKACEALADTYRQAIRKAGVHGDVSIVQGFIDRVAIDLARVGRACDLMMLDQPVASLDTKGLLLEEALFHSGRPVLIASPKKAFDAPPAAIMIAWDGSQHAARAVSDALSLFPTIEAAEIVSVKGEKDLSKSLPGADLAHHLARKGLRTTLTELPVKGATVGAVLDGHAMRTNADLMVMGGFGHSRLREFLFGGVTVELTQTASIPLLMAY